MRSLKEKEKKKLKKSGRDGGVRIGTTPPSAIPTRASALPSLPGVWRVRSEPGTHVGMMRKGLRGLGDNAIANTSPGGEAGSILALFWESSLCSSGLMKLLAM